MFSGTTSVPPDQQHKRSVIPIERVAFGQWLAGTVEEATELMRLPRLEVFEAGPLTASP